MDKIKELEAKLAVYENSPYSDAYIGVHFAVSNWANELKTKHFKISSTEEDDMKAFEKAHKAITSMKDFFEQLDYLRAKMTPEKAEESMKEAKNIFERALQSQGVLDANS